MSFQTLDTKFLSLDPVTAEGTFRGYASVYDRVDQQGDVVRPGAFTKTLQESGGRVPLLWNHDVAYPIGVGHLNDSPKGLFITGSLVLETEKGREAHALLRAGAISGLSIGFNTVKSHREDGARALTEVALWEVSLVTFPANTAARVEAVKQADPAAALAFLRAITLNMRVLAAEQRLARLTGRTR